MGHYVYCVSMTLYLFTNIIDIDDSIISRSVNSVKSNDKQETTVLNATHRPTSVLLKTAIASDLDEQRQMNKQAAHDRMLAVARAKDQTKHEILQGKWTE